MDVPVCAKKPATIQANTKHLYITFIQRRPNVSDVGPTLHKCYTNVLCLLGCRDSWQSSSALVAFFISISVYGGEEKLYLLGTLAPLFL